MAEFNIDSTADHIVELLRTNQYTEAFRELERHRQEQPQAVQEALDRMVSHRAGDELAALRERSPYPNDPEAASLAVLADETLGRVSRAAGSPRTPSEGEMDALTDLQKHDVYASIVETRGNDSAREDLENGRQVILGLRQENSTVDSADPDDPTAIATDVMESNQGTGVYDDRIVVLGERDLENPEVVEYNRANTEPSAQYDENAAGEIREAPYEDVEFRRRVDQEDADNDGVGDLGRMAEGTYEMGRSTSEVVGGAFVLRPTSEFVESGQGVVERDTNADGDFDAQDENGSRTMTDSSFLIHQGGAGNTHSAGCQTIPEADFYDNPDTEKEGDSLPDILSTDQEDWQYVLTETLPETPTETLPDNGLASSLRPQSRPEDLAVPAPETESPLRPQPRPAGLQGAAVELPDDPLMRQIREAFDRSGAGRGLDPEQRDNVLAASYRAFAPSVDHVGVYNGNVVGTRAPHGLGREPMDNIPINIAQERDTPAPTSLAAVERAEQQRMLVADNQSVNQGNQGIGARV